MQKTVEENAFFFSLVLITHQNNNVELRKWRNDDLSISLEWMSIWEYKYNVPENKQLKQTLYCGGWSSRSNF